MNTHDGCIHAILLDGKGGGRSLNWSEANDWVPEMGFLWLHFQLDKLETHKWLEQHSNLDTVIVDVLIDEENHPRIVWEEDLLFGTLRGINYNQQTEPEDMVFINFFLDSNRAVTIRKSHLMTIREIAQDLTAGRGPTGPGSLFTAILDRLHDRIEPILTKTEDDLDDYEQSLIKNIKFDDELKDRVTALRYMVIELRRFLAPQKIALTVLSKGAPTWLNKKRVREIREIEHRLQRFLGDLTSYKERTMVIRDEINNHMNEQMNRAMYMLAVLTGVFLPLGFLTGLLGINVGGMPGVESPWAFWVVCTVLVLLVGLNFVIFRLKRWI